MFHKICLLALLASTSFAIEQSYHAATSFASFNDNHNKVQHIHSAPSLVKSAPLHYSAPVHNSPPHIVPSYAAHSQSSQSYSAPQVSSQTFSFPANHFESFTHGVPAVHHSVPITAHASFLPAKAHDEEYYAHPKYEFAYGVEDHHSGDIHSHKETRDGDNTEGEYSLHEADGTIRTVKYTVDKHSGFNAVVERSGHPKEHVLQKDIPHYYHH